VCFVSDWLWALVAKALYRRALAYGTLKNDEDAEKALIDALALAQDDVAISAELERVRQRQKAKRDKERKAYKKMFA